MMKLEHVALWTRNLELLLAYYIKHFQGVAGPEYLNPRKDFRSYFVTFDNGPSLELMSVPGVTSGRETSEGRPKSGWTHIAFGVGSRREVDLKASELQKHGYRIIDGPRMTGDGFYEFSTLDPDDNLVEVSTQAHGEESTEGIPELTLQTIDLRLAICLMPVGTAMPDWASGSPFWSVTHSREETSVVCPEEKVPEGVEAEGNWFPLWVKGTLDFSLTGILHRLLEPLKTQKIPAFVLSTYRTDYLLIRGDDYEHALTILGGICNIEKIRSFPENSRH